MFDNGLKIVVTPDHKFLTEGGKWVEAKDLLGKKIMFPADKVLTRSRSFYDTTAVMLGFLAYGSRKKNGKFYIDVENHNSIIPFLKEYGHNGSKVYKEPKDFKVLSVLKARSDFIFSSKEKFLDFVDGFEFLYDFLVGLFEAVGDYDDGYAYFELYEYDIAEGLLEVLLSAGYSSMLVQDGEVYKVIVMNTKDFVENVRPFKVCVDCKNEYVNLKVIDIKNVGFVYVWDFKMNDESDWNNVVGLTCHNCSELQLYPYESCVLGSINLAAYSVVRRDNNGEYYIDWVNLGKLAFYGTIFLNAVVTLDKNRVEKITKNQKYLRRIGLGVMGWADMLLLLGIPYGSEESLELAKRIMNFITRVSVMTSNLLAKIEGPAPFYREHKDNLNQYFLDKLFSYELGKNEQEALELLKKSFNLEDYRFDIRNYPVRNVSWTSIAPTGSIAIMAGASHSIEPYYKLVYKRNLELGSDVTKRVEFIKVDMVERKLRELGYDDKIIRRFYEEYTESGIDNVTVLPEQIKRIFVDSHSLSPKQHVDMQAAFQEFTSNSISKTVNMPSTTKVKDVEDIIVYMHDSGIKSSTIYVDGSKAFQILE